MTGQNRETKPGFVLKAYERAKAKIEDLAGRGKAEAAALVSSKLPSGLKTPDFVTAGDGWKTNKAVEPVSEADEVRSQEEMKEAFGAAADALGARTDLPDGSATMVYEDIEAARAGIPASSAEAEAKRDDLDRANPQTQPGDVIGAQDNPAAPSMSALDEAALAKMANADADDAEVSNRGLGLDDGVGTEYPDDIVRH